MKPPESGSGNAGLHPSRLAMARMLAGDLEPEEKGAFEGHLAGCAHCGNMYRKAVATAEGFAAKYPSPEYLSGTRRSKRNSPEKAPSRWERILGYLGGARGLRPAFAALILLVAAGVVHRLSLPKADSDAFTAKGGPSFYLFLNGKQVLRDTVFCKPSDTLQLGITSSEPVYYAVLYRDDDGVVRPYMAAAGPDSRRIGAPNGENLPNSLVLDRGWTRERLYCIWSKAPIDPAAAEAFSADPPPANAPAFRALHRQSFLLLNQAP